MNGDVYSNGQSINYTANATITTGAEQVNSGDNGFEAAEYTFGATGLSYDLTTHLTQSLANAFRGSAQMLNIEKAGIQIGKIGKFTVGMGSKVLTGAGVIIPLADIAFNKNANYMSDGLDATMGGIAFIPGIGWVISGTYFITNAGVTGVTGESIGAHMGDFYNTHPDFKIGTGSDGISVFP